MLTWAWGLLLAPYLARSAPSFLLPSVLISRSEERRVGRVWGRTRSKRDWSSDVCSSDLNDKIHVETFASVLEPAVMEQAEQLAGMPFIHPHVALMPDAHVGMGSSVGTVFGTIGAVIPAAVGVDI